MNGCTARVILAMTLATRLNTVSDSISTAPHAEIGGGTRPESPAVCRNAVAQGEIRNRITSAAADTWSS